MGTGKTCVGRKVARSLGFRFVDTDEMVVEKAGRSIPDIFSELGEEEFRRLETDALRECARETGLVISTGGGIVTQSRNLPILRQAGYVIWLKAAPETIADRTSRNRNRPLLATADPEKTIRDLMAKRKDQYREAADLEVTTDDLTIDETVYGVSESARLALDHR